MSARRWARDLAGLAFLALVTAVAFWKVLVTSAYTNLAGWDQSIQWYAWYRFAADWVRQGVLPLWDPYVYGGHSFIGEAQTGVFYPLNLLQAFLIPADRSLAPSDMYWMAAFHAFLAASFMYIFARVLGMRIAPALVGGIIYAFGGFLGRHLHVHIDIFYGFAWLPLILTFFHLGVRKRRLALAVAAGLVLGITALVGHLPPPVYSTLVLIVYAGYLTRARWRQQPDWRARLFPLFMLATTGVFAVGVASVQMLPSLEYEPLALKWTGASEIDPISGSDRRPYWVAGEMFYLHPQNLISFLMPHVYEPAERSAYLGIFTLLLVFLGVTGKRRSSNRFFTLLAVVAFLFALGGESIVHGLVWLALPFMDKVRVAVRALLVVSFSCALLAGWGMEALLEGEQRTKRLLAGMVHFGGYAVGGLLLSGLALAIWGSKHAPGAQLDPLFSLIIMVFLAWLAIALWRPLRLAPHLWSLLAIGVLLFDLLSYGSGNFQLISAFDNKTNWAPEIYYRENGAVRFLRQQPGYFRVDNWNDALPPNFGDVWYLQGVMGYNNTLMEDYRDLRSLAWYPPSRLYDMLNIRYIVTTDTVKTLPLVYDGNVAAGDFKVYENPTALPRAWVVHKVTQVAPGDATWKQLASPGFDPVSEAIVASPVDLPPGGNGGTARITEYTLHAIAVAVDTPLDALLVMSENDYPGWTARVDGQPAEIVRVNGGLRGVRAPSGRHDVIFTYAPMSFKIGAIITGLTLLIAALILLASLIRWRRRSTRQP